MIRSLKLIALALAASLVAGCAQIPMSGAVNRGPDMNGGLASDYLYYSPSGPAVDATAVDVINGFINAGTGPQNDYAVAREYLSRKLSTSWTPSAQTLVQTGRPVMVQNPETEVYNLTANVISEIDADGQMNSVDETRNLTFHVIKEDGQWRIDKAPDLTLLIKPVFDVIFQSYSLYFFDRPKQYLVPDVRWFPSRASTGTRLMNALLKGPNPWLAPAVTSVIPTGTKLNTAAVTIDRGIAVVDLSSKALKSSSYDKQLLRAQIFATLTQLPTVLDVNIQIDRSPQQISSVNQPQRQSPSTTAFTLIGHDIYVQGEAAGKPLTGLHDYLARSKAYDFAITEDQGFLALLGKEGLSLAYPGTRAAGLKLVDTRRNLTTPAIDAHDFVWSLSKDRGHGFRVFNGRVAVATFSPAWMRSLQNKRFSISPDGARLLVSGSVDGQSYLYATGIIRNENGVPRLADTKVLLSSAKSEAIEINWVSDIEFVMTQSALAGSQNPQLVTLGGVSTNLPAFSSSSRLAASASGQIIYLLTSVGELFTIRNQGWAYLRGDVRAIHFAQ